MSYQYPPSPHNGVDMDFSHPGYMANHPLTIPSSMEVTPPQQVYSVHPPEPLATSSALPTLGIHPQLAHRQDSLSQDFKLKRSSSTPNVRAHGTDDPGHGSADKKRGKLNYHRTSVACGHCRKRKIRCIPSTESQGQCASCAKLKRPCIYYPVDQQPLPMPGPSPQPPRVRPTVGSSSSRLASTPATSSPTIPSGYPTDAQPHQAYHPLNTMTLSRDMGPPPPSSVKQGIYSADQKLPASASRALGDFDDYGQGVVVPNWAATETSPRSATRSPEDATTPWRHYPNEPPQPTPAFSPYGAAQAAAPPTATTWPGMVHGGPVGTDDAASQTQTQTQDAWALYPAPTRSMSVSYGGGGGGGGGHFALSTTTRPYDRKASSTTTADTYHAPVTTTNMESMSGGAAFGPRESLSAGAVPSTTYGAWQHSYQHPKPGEAYGGWYGDPGGQMVGGHVLPSGPEHPGNLYYGGRRQ